MNKHDVVNLVNDYLVRYPDDEHALKTLDFLLKNELYWQRENIDGHLTASAWIFDSSESKVLMIYHQKLEKWFQPGGHFEKSDLNLFDAATREAKEETGISEMEIFENEIFDIDVHSIPNHKEVLTHYHYDLRILMKASSKSELIENKNEVSFCNWIPMNKVQEYNNNTSVMRLLAKTTKKLY